MNIVDYLRVTKQDDMVVQFYKDEAVVLGWILIPSQDTETISCLKGLNIARTGSVYIFGKFKVPITIQDSLVQGFLTLQQCDIKEISRVTITGKVKLLECRTEKIKEIILGEVTLPDLSPHEKSLLGDYIVKPKPGLRIRSYNGLEGLDIDGGVRG